MSKGNSFGCHLSSRNQAANTTVNMNAYWKDFSSNVTGPHLNGTFSDLFIVFPTSRRVFHECFRSGILSIQRPKSPLQLQSSFFRFPSQGVVFGGCVWNTKGKNGSLREVNFVPLCSSQGLRLSLRK